MCRSTFWWNLIKTYSCRINPGRDLQRRLLHQGRQNQGEDHRQTDKKCRQENLKIVLLYSCWTIYNVYTSQMNPFLFLREWWNLLTVRAIMCFAISLEPEIKVFGDSSWRIFKCIPSTFTIGLFGLLDLVRTDSSTSWIGTSESRT